MRSALRTALLGFVPALVPVLLLTLAVAPAAHAQKKNALPAFYAKWLNEEVTYIITEEEKKGFQKLTSDADRDLFIQDFWEARNPVPHGVPNSYKQEHYARLQYANDTFGRQSNTPGWRTDMGRTWIIFGKPKSHVSFKGYSQLYPCDLWFYSNETGDPAFPSFFSVLFYMPEDISEYRYYRPFLDGPMQLVRGTQFNSNADVYNFLRPVAADLAIASMSLIPGDPIDTDTFVPSMTSDLLISRIRDFANDYFNEDRIRQMRSLQAHVTTYFMASDQRPVDVNALVLADPAGQYWVDYTVAIDRAELGKPESDEKSLGVALSYRLLTEDGKVVLEDSSERDWPAFEPTNGAKPFLPFQIAGRLPVAPGKYRLEIEIPQKQSGKVFHGQQSLVVGGGGPFQVSGPLLVTGITQVGRPDSTTPFQYFGTQFQPAAKHLMSTRLPLRVLYQLEAATPEDLEIEYLLAHNQIHEARRTVTDTVKAAQFRDGRVMTSKAIPLTGLPDGEYRLVTTVRRPGSAEVLTSTNVALRVDSSAVDEALYFDPNTKKMNEPGVAAYIRALCAMSLGDADRAVALLRQAVEQNPANSLASVQLVRSYFKAKRYADVIAMYNKFGEKPFEGSVESLAQLSLSLWNAGQREGARSVLSDAKLAYPQDPLVAAVAKTVR